MNHLCTITTSDHLYKVYALRDSLVKYDNNILLHVLVVDNNEPPQADYIKSYRLADLDKDETAKSIISKYSNDKLRWSLKPSFLKFLLGKDEISKAIYLDNDLFFFNAFTFLFEHLSDHAFLFTPHYYDRSPEYHQNWLEANFRAGLFNAGFIGVNKSAVHTLQWWAECCLYCCKKSAFRGTFDDQKYLDLIPVMRDDVMILRHQGCNVAEWNRFLCLRELVNGQVMINGIWPVVFIHFNNTTIREITDGTEPLLVDFFNQYMITLKKYKPGIEPKNLYRKPATLDLMKYAVWKFLTVRGI
jgi:hypothetical protein